MYDEKARSLLRLLDDPDPEISNTVENALIELGIEVIPTLESAWENSMNEDYHTRLENLIHLIQFNFVKDGLNQWIHSSEPDLLEGVVWVCRHQYPDLKPEDILQKLHQIRFDLWIELNEEQTALEKIKTLNRLFFDVYKFSGNASNYYSPKNSYINQVIETRKGNPILLTVVYICVARLAGIPIYGVNLPLNFVAGYADTTEIVSPSPELAILFYINPFSKGGLFSKAEIDIFLEEHKIEPRPEFYQACSHAIIVKRIISNLILSYEKLGYVDKIKELNQLISLFQE
jgi:regulator of sirC expression with transglutaminase-like and TPR domain